MQFEQLSNPSNFVKLKDGERIVGVFRGDVYKYKQHWSNNKSETCTKEATGSCPHCAEGKRPGFRFNLNFLTMNSEGVFEAKIFQGGAKVYNTLKGLHESDYNLEKTMVSIARAGSTKDDTVYTILPTRDCDITEAKEAVISKVPLLDLGPKHEDDHEDQNVPF